VTSLKVTFAAGSVLVAATLCRDLDLKLDSGQGKASWDKVVEIFRFLAHDVSSAGKGLEALEWFRRAIFARVPDPIGSGDMTCFKAIRSMGNTS
jgi:hypothetical protein